MKILRAVILGVLVTVCAITAVVVVSFLRSGSDADGVQPRERVRNNAGSEEPDEPEAYVFETWNEFKFWQRSVSQNRETGHWHYYPLIPYKEVLPGETVVLSVSSVDFLGWEVDGNYADVTLFDEKTDDENAYVSFIMPNAEVFVIALYNEVPIINMENQMRMRDNSMREQGSAFSTLSDGGGVITPIPVVPTNLPDAVRLEYYRVDLRDPIISPETLAGRRIRWVMNETDPPVIDGLGGLPTGLTFRATPLQENGGGFIQGYPSVERGVYLFSADMYLVTDLDPVGVFFDNYVFRIEIWPAGPDPTITTRSVPDGMVDVPYYTMINTIGFREGSMWLWETDIASPPPEGPVPGPVAGLIIRNEPGDFARGVIEGTPIGPTANIPFVIKVSPIPLNAAIRDVFSSTLNIQIWERPGLSLIQKAGDTPVWPPEPPIPEPPDLPVRPPFLGPMALLDGMVDVAYGHGAAIVADYISGLPGTWEYRILNRGLLNSGLTLNTTNGLVTGTNPALPTADAIQPHTYIFDVQYTTDRTDIIIGWSETVRFEVKIWPQPVFYTDERLPDGMVGPDPADPIPEPPEVYPWYSTIIETDLIPPGTEWDMSIPAGTLTPYQLSYGYDPLGTYITIVGGPTHFTSDRHFTFPVALRPTTATTDENPNFNIAPIIKNYTIKIWRRYFLHVDVPDRADPGYVFREGEPMPTPANMPLYAGRRAVMPGQQGIVRAELATIPFVRWEVQEDNFLLRSVQIGGPTAPTSSSDGWWTDARYGYARVSMPPVNNRFDLTPPLNDNLASTSNNVTIRGVITDQVPDIRWSNSIGHVGDPTYTGSLMFTRPFGGSPTNRFDGDVGIYGPVTGKVPDIQPQPQVGWEISEGSPSGIPGIFAPAPGLNTSLPSGDVTVLTGMPTQAGTFQFRVAITLPGTMKIIMPITTNPYDLTIRPALGLIVGDVDRSGAVNLADVIMLAKFLRDELTAAELAQFDADAANIRNEGVRPNRRDLELLVEWFSNPDITSGFDFPIGSDRPRNPDR